MGKRPQPRLRIDALTGEWRNGEAGEGRGSELCEPGGLRYQAGRASSEGPPLGPGGEDITWPDQVAPRGRKASSTRKSKPQTSNLLWLSARPGVSRIWPGPLPGPLWIRLGGEEGEAGGRVRAWGRPVPCCRWVAGSEKRGPRPGGCRRKSGGFLCVLDTTGCEGRPPLSRHLLHVSGRLMSLSSVCLTVRCCWGVLRGCVPLGRRGRTCGQARLRVLGARPMRRNGAPWRLLKFACRRAGRAAWVSASVRTAGCSQLPSTSARIWWRALFDNTPVVMGSAAGSACLAGPFAGRRGRISTPLTTPWCAASGAAPTARGSRERGLGARCLPSPTQWPSGGRGVGLGAGG